MTRNSFPKSVHYALNGFAHALTTERNIMLQVIATILVLIFALILKISRIEFILILIACFFVIILELINTAIERMIDKIHPEQHEEIGRVKDIMAAVVLMSVFLAVIIGMMILLEPFSELIMRAFN